MKYKYTPEHIEAAASAIANARGGRRGAPQIANILKMLPANLVGEVTEDAKAVLEVLPDVAPQWIGIFEALPELDNEVHDEESTEEEPDTYFISQEVFVLSDPRFPGYVGDAWHPVAGTAWFDGKNWFDAHDRLCEEGIKLNVIAWMPIPSWSKSP